MRLLSRDERPTSAKVVRNAFFGVIRIIFVAPVPFVLIPCILKKVGLNGYGTWAVFLAINSLTSLADLGLVATLSKHVAEHYTHRDFTALNRLMNTGLVLYALTAFFVVSVLWVGSPVLISLLFRGSTIPTAELRILFHGLLVIVGVNILIFLFSSVVTGLQRMDLSTIVSSFNIVSGAVLSIAFLAIGWGLRGLLYANIWAVASTLLTYVWVVHKLLPEVHFDLTSVDWQEMKQILRFSLTLYLTQVAVVINNQVEKLYLAWFVGVVPVGWYDIASDVALKVRRVPEVLLGPIIPAASELDAQGDHLRLAELFYRTHKYLAFVGVPLVFYGVAIAKRFVGLWIGPNFDVIAIPLGVLLLVNLFNLTTGPGYLILIGRGVLEQGVYSAVVGILLNVFLSFFFIRAYGFTGAVIGTALSLVIACGFFHFLFRQYTGYSFRRLFREAYVKPLLCSLPVLVILFSMSPAVRLGWAGLVAQAFAFGAVYFLSLVLARFFDQFDLAKIESFFPILRVARKIIPVA